MNSPSKIMILAGEASGDMHGAALISALKAKSPDLEIFGVGGDGMIAAGQNAQFHIKDMAFLGLVEILKHLPFIKQVQKKLLETIKEQNIRNVVLIDYPGFNLNFGKKLKRLGINIIYYISPQIWAWGKNRIKKIIRIVDEMLVVFPFEKDFYESYGMKAEFVGHPLIERMENYNFISKEALFEKFNLNNEKEILLLMPGSRKQEIERLFSTMLSSAKRIADKFNMQIVVLTQPHIDSDELKNSGAKVVEENHYDFMKHSKFGIIKSGTSTLEAGLSELPMLVVYSTNYLTYLIGRALVKIDNIAMINIISNETVAPELIQSEVNENKIFKTAEDILSNQSKYEEIKKKLANVKGIFGSRSASNNAAEIILKHLRYEKG
ncbi:MAG: lipid-A-disaccharide synthase [Chlorobi bacterium]|nr:lipid-A-disaccharide synthase [Chlorobiota bacterium]